MNIPEEVEFQKVQDASGYKVTYLYNDQEKVIEGYKEADGIQLDQYIKENADTEDIY